MHAFRYVRWDGIMFLTSACDVLYIYIYIYIYIYYGVHTFKYIRWDGIMFLTSACYIHMTVFPYMWILLIHVTPLSLGGIHAHMRVLCYECASIHKYMITLHTVCMSCKIALFCFLNVAKPTVCAYAHTWAQGMLSLVLEQIYDAHTWTPKHRHVQWRAQAIT